MKKSSRGKRMERRHAKHRGVATLNLTSLMDIFTILVFFLLVNSSNTQQPPDNKDIVLPESSAEMVPDDVLKIQISARSLLVQDVSIDSAVAENEDGISVIPALVEELNFRASRSLPVLNADGEAERELMILADRQVPYSTIRNVMVSASQTEYSKISFAVLRKAEEDIE
ncbi:MAG: biopolymer transporter ExbD [Gammaproteobacteria bacterium HGW-Gammaproteobacteria-14]|nr:MAG: biopolymer transporter ExbD [Gammaproteobacteria bacterium HGW-Gammaproteobacteria-14]